MNLSSMPGRSQLGLVDTCHLSRRVNSLFQLGTSSPRDIGAGQLVYSALVCISPNQLVTKPTLFYSPYMLSWELYKKTRRGARCLSCGIHMVYLAMVSPPLLFLGSLRKGIYIHVYSPSLCVSVCSGWWLCHVWLDLLPNTRPLLGNQVIQRKKWIDR